jgi:hypothetical protein
VRARQGGSRGPGPGRQLHQWLVPGLMTVAAMVKGKGSPGGLLRRGRGQPAGLPDDRGKRGPEGPDRCRRAHPGAGLRLLRRLRPGARSGGVSVRTNNRNFQGEAAPRTPKSTGEPRGRRSHGAHRPADRPPGPGPGPPVHPAPGALLHPRRPGDPASEGSGGAVYRGPNIGEPPRQTPLPDRCAPGIAIKLGDKITTDHIIPAGPVSRYRSNIPGRAILSSTTSTPPLRSVAGPTSGRGWPRSSWRGSATVRAPPASMQPCARPTWAYGR